MSVLIIDDKEIQATEGSTLLQTCIDNEIYIPNLCYVRGMEEPPVSCRLCFVAVEGESKPVPSCAVSVRDGMIVKTDTPEVRRLQRSAFHLLMSVHRSDPKCTFRKQCELIRIAKFLKTGLTPGRLKRILKDNAINDSHPFFTIHANRCVLCGKCTYICRKVHGYSFLTFAKRGFDTIISFYGVSDEALKVCRNCGACVRICPVGALTKKPLTRNI